MLSIADRSNFIGKEAKLGQIVLAWLDSKNFQYILTYSDTCT